MRSSTKPARRNAKKLRARCSSSATEYGDVLPQAGVPYRVSNQISSSAMDATSPNSRPSLDGHCSRVCRRRAGAPTHPIAAAGLQSRSGQKRYRKFQLYGLHQWGVAAKGIKGPRDYRVYFAWRRMADSASPLHRHGQRTATYPLRVQRRQRLFRDRGNLRRPCPAAADERRGIYLTLGALYYFQHELGLNWSLAEDEGYDTPYNRAKMKALALRSDLEPLARHCRRYRTRRIAADGRRRHTQSKRLGTVLNTPST